ncbi:DUF4381 domain-containing protein [Candidatus Foliamicus sp.]
MNESVGLSAQLRDIHLPPEPAWWPPQPGWWLLALAVLAAAIWWLLRLPAWKREALARMRALQAEYARHGDAARLLAEVSVLLRSCALFLRGRPETAGLVGRAWLDCLAELGRGVGPQPGGALTEGAYRERMELDAQAFISSVTAWIRRARAPRRGVS